VQWAEDWSQARIDAGRAGDRRAKERYYGPSEEPETTPLPTALDAVIA
jgi:hypothetical protein